MGGRIRIFMEMRNFFVFERIEESKKGLGKRSKDCSREDFFLLTPSRGKTRAGESIHHPGFLAGHRNEKCNREKKGIGYRGGNPRSAETSCLRATKTDHEEESEGRA